MAVALAACDGGPRSVLPGPEPSEALRPWITFSLDRLESARDGRPDVLEDLEAYARLTHDIYDLATREEAQSRFLDLWSTDPANVLWAEFEYFERRHVPQRDPRVHLALESEAYGTTETARGVYLKAWRQRGDDRPASLSRAHTLIDDATDDFDALWIRLRSAFGFRQEGEPDSALALALTLLPDAHALGGGRLAARVWEEVARTQMARGALDDALLAVTVADTLANAALAPGNAHTDVHFLRDLRARILANRREVPAALRACDELAATALDEDLGYFAISVFSLASSLAETMGDRDASFDYARRAAALTLADEDSLIAPRALMNLARRHMFDGAYDSCRALHARAQEIVAAYPHPRNVERMPLLLAEFHTHLGQVDVVDSLLLAATTLSDGSTSDEMRAEIHLERIKNYLALDQPYPVHQSIAAIEDLREGFADTHTDRNVSFDLNLCIGEFYTKRGEIALAVDALDRAEVQLARRPDPKRTRELARARGELASVRGSFDEALASFERCIELSDETGQTHPGNEGRILRASVLLEVERYADARTTLEAIDPHDVRQPFRTRILSLLLRARSHRLEDRSAEALSVLGEARRILRPWSPTDLVARVDLEAALCLADRGRSVEARTSLETIAEALDDATADEATEELDSFNGDLRRNLVEAYLRLDGVDAHASLDFARRVLPGWNTADDPTLAAPQVVTFVGRRRGARWLVSGEGITVHALPAAATLVDLVTPVLADLSTPGRTPRGERLDALASVLLDGVAPAWDGTDGLLIVPDGILASVPFAALPLTGAETVVERGATIVLDRPAHRAPVQPLRRDAIALVVGANGASLPRGSGLSRLRQAEAEARDVAALFPATRVELGLGDAAARLFRQGAALDRYGVIHVASHAVVYPGRDDQSTLVFTGGDDDVSALRIRGLDLDADLVFLSCCEAGDGDRRRSPSAGLARGFLRAGARRVVAPTIVLDDEAARRFATTFHRRWNGETSVAEAVRAAQLELRADGGDWAHPFYWAFYEVYAPAAD